MESFLHDMSWAPALRNETLTVIFNAFTYLGYTPFFLAFLPVGYLLCDKKMFTRLAVLIAIVGFTNSYLKDLFQDPRPPVEFAIDARVGDSYGFPSGHAQIAFAMWLWLAIEIGRVWAWALAIIIALGVCASRLYLGVHDVEDILGGSLLGISTVIIYRGLVSDQFKWWHDLNPIVHLIAIAALAPLIWAIWPGKPAPDAIYGLVAFLFFWWLGRAVEERFIHYRRHANWIVAGVSTIVAVGVLFLSFKVIGDAFAAAHITGPIVTVVTFGFISFYVTALVPALLRIVGLARIAP